ncbi:helix-turn-helix domain-containing protein [Rhodobacter ferrooxidans]|uniref:Transcriptional regulator, XRE family n=1 Tax=Rhodobacter ferrooxidans TaxID=371731 RepID=C8S4V4_9RHOB|nr:helix-turn-helix transcriptional regulator [Rhodobacter sp. SW2]EEW24013.1 transcriptional regulator, XRE family [Rhodobacter sp. SW2]
MTPAQSRAARAMIGLSQEEIAKASGVGIQTLIAFESGKRQPYARTLDAIRAALEASGVVFLPENGNGPGVALRKEHKQ